MSEDDLFTYMYTSGTTGPPKACMVLHRNYYAMVGRSRRDGRNCHRGRHRAPLPPPRTQLRPAHPPLRAVTGLHVAFCADPHKVADALLEVRPTVFPSVPRIYEKMHAAVLARFDAATGVSKGLIDWAVGVGMRVCVLRESQTPVPRGLAAAAPVANKLVYSKVKERLGGRLRIALSGGAPLSPEILSSSTRSTS